MRELGRVGRKDVDDLVIKKNIVQAVRGVVTRGRPPVRREGRVSDYVREREVELREAGTLCKERHR